MAYCSKRVSHLLSQPITNESCCELIELNKGLVVNQLRKFYLLFDEDAMSAGLEGLWIAIKQYDGATAAFSTYATIIIYNKLSNYIRSNKSKEKDFILSYDAPVGEDGYTHLDLIDGGKYADGDILHDNGVDNIRTAVQKCYNELRNPVHKRIIKAWADSEFTWTQAKIAEYVGCTQTYVSYILKPFKYKLEETLNGL